MNSWTRYLFCTYFKRATQVLKCQIKHMWNDSMMTIIKSDTNVFTVSELNLYIEFLPSANKVGVGQRNGFGLSSVSTSILPSVHCPAVTPLKCPRICRQTIPQIGFSLGFVDEWDIIWLTFVPTVSWYVICWTVSAHLQQQSSLYPMVELIV